MGMFLKKFENLKITLITYKPTQIFTPFRNTKNFYEFQNAVEGIYKIIDELNENMENSNFANGNNGHLIILDEYPSLIQTIDDRKKRDEVLSKISILLHMGREYGMLPIISANRRRFITI